MRHPSWAERAVSKGDIRLELSLQKAYLAEGDQEADLELTPIEFELLHYFIRNEERVLSHDQLFNVVGGGHKEVVDRATIDRHLSSLRRKLSYRSHYIETIPRVGYRFTLSECQGKRSA